MFTKEHYEVSGRCGEVEARRREKLRIFKIKGMKYAF
jgi:hypothetical protein